MKYADAESFFLVWAVFLVGSVLYLWKSSGEPVVVLVVLRISIWVVVELLGVLAERMLLMIPPPHAHVCTFV